MLPNHGHGYRSERLLLRKSWASPAPRVIDAQQRALLGIDGVDLVWEFALSLHSAVAQDIGGLLGDGSTSPPSAPGTRARLLHGVQFDNDKFGSWYEDMVTVHRILMADPGSPWLNIPFR
ncbi:hypothetical protein [Streptomyces sp. NPDC056468]|uniref:hypothetical protein n=1 Tax=Streptomyces sp. NPDC056468 TaxID=3345830 RepID=UPI0036BFF3B3